MAIDSGEPQAGRSAGKGPWVDVNINGAEGCPPMVLRITKASRNRVKFALFAVE